MVAGSITEEVALAVPAELLWKAVFATGDESSMRNVLTGLSDMAVKVDGDGRPGSRYTLKFNPGVGAATVHLKSRLVARDDAARVITYDEVAVNGGEVPVAAAQLKSQVVQYKVDPAGAGGCVTKLLVDYESLDGTPLSPADETKLIKGYVGLVKKAEENIIARPGEFA
ncbi:unnamed protein product [Urochloa decumbens]|uniref:Bet v I/Major latex protein domain-containing protein n=2 Tax=Urochloa decumbens TaxID=240449 RepID=A0ABC9BJB3_9POAL